MQFGDGHEGAAARRSEGDEGEQQHNNDDASLSPITSQEDEEGQTRQLLYGKGLFDIYNIGLYVIDIIIINTSS